MTRPKTKSDAAVLAAAGRVLVRRGPHDFTLADVAAEAGLSPATLLQRFGTKRGLLVAFARWAAAQADAPFEAAARRGGSPLTQLRRALLILAGPAANRREFANHLALLLEDVRDPDLRRAAAEHARRTEEQIAGLLRAAESAGELAMDDPARWARTLVAAWNGALIQWGLRGQDSLASSLDDVLGPLLQPRGPGRSGGGEAPRRPSRS